MLKENEIIKNLLEREEADLLKKLQDENICDYNNIKRYYEDIKKLRIKYTDKLTTRKQQPITEAKRQKAIENFKKSMMKNATYNNRLSKGHTNNGKVYYIDGYQILQTDENIGLEILQENESINCERIFFAEADKKQHIIKIDYTDICEYIAKGKEYKKQNNDNNWKIYPLQSNEITTFVNIDYIKQMLEMTKATTIKISDPKSPIIFENEKHQAIGLITPINQKGNEAQNIERYNTIKNNF